MIDLTWGGWIKGRRTAAEMGLPYIRVQGAENHPFVQAADDFLESQVYFEIVYDLYPTIQATHISRYTLIRSLFNIMIYILIA